jgi:PAS domain S-box-containing protein
MTAGTWVLLVAVAVVIAAALGAYHLHLRRGRRFMRAQLALLRSERDAMRKSVRDAEQARRDAEAELRLKQELCAVLLATTRRMVFTFALTPDGLPGRLTDANDAMCRNLDYDRDALLNLTPMDIGLVAAPASMPGFTRTQLATVSDAEIDERRHAFATRDAQTMVKHILDETHAAYDRTFVSRSGRRIPVHITACRLNKSGEPSIVCMAEDISERQETERALRESEGRFQDVFTNSPIGMALYDADRSLVMVNRACLSMLGIPDRTEFTKFNLFDNPFLPGDIRQAMQRGDSCRYEGSIDFEQVRAQSLFVTGKRGQAHFDIQVTNLGLDRDFKPQGYLAQLQDITKRVKAESALHQSERQLRQAQKMEAIGTLAGGIAHDFNNILTPILGYTEMTLYSCDKDNPIREYMQEVLKASHRAKDLVNQILTFSRQSDKEGRPIRVTPIVKEVLKLIAATTPPNIEIQRVLKTDQDVVIAEPTQLHQVLMNLCTNAIHAMESGGGVIEARMMDFVIGSRAKSEFPQLEPGRYLRLSVKDTGSGMTQATLDRIFEPFFTTKESGKGTGMGLAVVHGIVSSLHGTIAVDTEVGKGSTFHVILPVVEQEEARGAAMDEPLPSGHECVLYVDDSKEIAALAQRMLSALEYTPVVVNSAAEALDLFKRNPDRFDLVITDQVMAGMDGIDLARELLSIRKDIPIVLCTGYSESVSRQDVEAVGIRGFMSKPISMRDLAEAVRRTLDNKGGEFVRTGPQTSPLG